MSLCLDKPKNVSFKSNLKNNIVNVGETVKIICKAEGFPAPNYNIFHNCIKITDNGVKIINSVSIHDGGGYVCVAKNELGELSASKMVTACHETVYIVLPSDKLLLNYFEFLDNLLSICLFPICYALVTN